ncbi:MAG: hypothetical protein ACK568_04870, partial [Pseudanabaena sp.]
PLAGKLTYVIRLIEKRYINLVAVVLKRKGFILVRMGGTSRRPSLPILDCPRSYQCKFCFCFNYEF